MNHFLIKMNKGSVDLENYDMILEKLILPASDSALEVWRCERTKQEQEGSFATKTVTTMQPRDDGLAQPPNKFHAVHDHTTKMLPMAAALLANDSPEINGLKQLKLPNSREIKAYLVESCQSPLQLKLPPASRPSAFTFALAILGSIIPIPRDVLVERATVLASESVAYVYNLIPFSTMQGRRSFLHSVVALQMLSESFRGFHISQTSKDPRPEVLDLVAQMRLWVGLLDEKGQANSLDRMPQDMPDAFDPITEALKSFELDQDDTIFRCPLVCGLQMHSLLKAAMTSGMAYCNEGGCLGTVLHLYNYVRSFGPPIPILEVLRESFSSQLFPECQHYPTEDFLSTYQRFFDAESGEIPQTCSFHRNLIAAELQDSVLAELPVLDQPLRASEWPLSLAGVSTLYTLPPIPFTSGLFAALPSRFPNACKRQQFQDLGALE